MSEFKKQHYLLVTLDPVHIGTGGYRLGRVDLSIVREPGTRIPKIPGTSIHGAIRSYAAYLYENPAAAGQSQDNVEKPDKDPICYTFGYIKKTEQGEVKAYSGVVNVFDAQVVLFPVYSTVGPVWVSTKMRLEEAGFTINNISNAEHPDRVFLTWSRTEPINLGWLMVGVEGSISVTAPPNWEKDKYWTNIKDRIVVVSDYLFSHIVNSNLEVRTSVSINPETGAAEEKALFTYEAIPRSTFLTMDIVLDDYRAGSTDSKDWPFPVKQTAKNNSLPGGTWKGPLDVVKAGLQMMKLLGVGGMGTRGFGRVSMVGEPVEE
ncbi:type III-B CRISPR module RAMP protein Cmr4 [Caldanaerobius polysaccharolyticus]|uniref:type III-B CRISPR module RAMP protein Cmr4 n=1 Tax=Caldanaerobius polysaccharolyticus TaxID=44256 RepID=UPI00047BFD74|nr:type III-B CRISPR module RAMP protein Cmr4 [Caldanaerobius polysaccharolyticus]